MDASRCRKENFRWQWICVRSLSLEDQFAFFPPEDKSSQTGFWCTEISPVTLVIGRWRHILFGIARREFLSAKTVEGSQVVFGEFDEKTILWNSFDLRFPLAY